MPSACSIYVCKCGILIILVIVPNNVVPSILCHHAHYLASRGNRPGTKPEPFPSSSIPLHRDDNIGMSDVMSLADGIIAQCAHISAAPFAARRASLA